MEGTASSLSFPSFPPSDRLFSPLQEMHEMLSSPSKSAWEPQRSLLIAALRMEIYPHSGTLLPDAINPWICLSAFHEDLTSKPTHPDLAHPTDLFRKLNLLYRRVFVRWSLFSFMTPPTQTYILPLAAAAADRQYAAIEALDLPLQVKYVVKKRLNVKEERFKMMMEGKLPMPPPVPYNE